MIKVRLTNIFNDKHPVLVFILILSRVAEQRHLDLNVLRHTPRDQTLVGVSNSRVPRVQLEI